MNDKTRRVFNGWLQLTPDERREFDDAVRRYHEATEYEKRQTCKLHEGYVLRMHTGPLGSTCPCCGR